MDGRTRPDRIAAVLRAIDADIIALQEVIGAGPTRREPDRGDRRSARHGVGHGAGPHLARPSFGNAVLSRLPIAQHVAARSVLEDLRAARRCSAWTSTCAATRCTCTTSTSGTAILERRHQAERLATLVADRHVGGAKIVLGDFNEWMRGLATTLLSSRLNSVDLQSHLRRRRTYPGLFPILHLDHIYYAGRVEIVGIELPRTRLSLVASDHLPLVADVRIGS